MSENIAAAIAAKNEVIAQQGTSLDEVAAVLETKAAGGTDISLGLTSAAVGQIIKVKAVDESGKPTAWEAANMNSGWRLINDITLSESEVSSVEIMNDLNGEPFSCSAIYAAVFGKASSESGWNILVCCSTNPSYQNTFHNFGLAGACLTTNGLWAQAHIEHILNLDWAISINKSATGVVSAITSNSYTGLPRVRYNSWAAKPDGDIRGVKIEPFSGTFSEGFRVILYGRDA